VGSIFQITDVIGSVGPAGNPSTNRFPQHSPNFWGVADINAFCLHKGYSYGQISPRSETSNNLPDITIACMTLYTQRTGIFAGQQVCQQQFPSEQTVRVDRLVKYFDPSTLRCYKNVRFLGPIGNDLSAFARACRADAQNVGLYNNQSERLTAYDWQCQPGQAGELPRGLSISDACSIEYGVSNAFDRLVNHSKPDGWGMLGTSLTACQH
jgi:hypothetical protein